jgi:hypothetical protein
MVRDPVPSPGAYAPSTPQPYPIFFGSVLIVVGLLLGMAWAFRAWTVVLLAPGDPALISHALVTLVSLGASVLLSLIGWRTFRRRAHSTDGAWLTVIGLWIAGVGVHRLVAVLTHPVTDPNPRAHLHLSVLFMVIGAFLLGMAWFWRRNAPGSALRDRRPA